MISTPHRRGHLIAQPRIVADAGGVGKRAVLHGRARGRGGRGAWAITRYTGLVATPLAVLGLAMVALGLAALVACFVQSVREGRGTPAPIAPMEKLVVGGLPLVRNPMYLAVGAIILGQAVAFASVGCRSRSVFAVAVVSFVTASAAHPAQDVRRLVRRHVRLCRVVAAAHAVGGSGRRVRPDAARPELVAVPILRARRTGRRFAWSIRRPSRPLPPPRHAPRGAFRFHRPGTR